MRLFLKLIHYAQKTPTEFLSSESIYLSREDKVAFREAVNLVRPDGDFRSSPAERDVRMMPLLFRQLAYAIHERERLTKIFELKNLSQVMLLDNLPVL